MNKRHAALWTVVVLTLWISLAVTRPASAQYTEITTFTKTNNAQTVLFASYPTGMFTANDAFATPFNITSDGNGNNYAAIQSPEVINVGVFGVTDAYTLLNSYNNPTATVLFTGSGGATQTFTLVGGTDVRDFYQGGNNAPPTGTNTENAYLGYGQGGGGTGDVNTGLTGYYAIDEQHFALSSAFASQTLTSITITGEGRPAVLQGLTVARIAPSSTVPEPSSLASLATGGFGLLGLVWRSRRMRRRLVLL